MSADDDSRNPGESEASTGQADLAQLEDRIDLAVEYIGELEERLGHAEAERDQLREELEAERQARQEAIAALRERISDVEAWTDMRRLVERVDGATGKQRSMALVQHLQRKAVQNERNGKRPRARLNKESAEEALHHPDIGRTQVYKDMQRAAGWFPKDVCWYDSGELWLDTSNVRGELSQHVDGVKASPQLGAGSGGKTARSDGGFHKRG